MQAPIPYAALPPLAFATGLDPPLLSLRRLLNQVLSSQCCPRRLQRLWRRGPGRIASLVFAPEPQKIEADETPTADSLETVAFIAVFIFAPRRARSPTAANPPRILSRNRPRRGSGPRSAASACHRRPAALCAAPRLEKRPGTSRKRDYGPVEPPALLEASSAAKKLGKCLAAHEHPVRFRVVCPWSARATRACCLQVAYPAGAVTSRGKGGSGGDVTDLIYGFALRVAPAFSGPGLWAREMRRNFVASRPGCPDPAPPGPAPSTCSPEDNQRRRASKSARSPGEGGGGGDPMSRWAPEVHT